MAYVIQHLNTDIPNALSDRCEVSFAERSYFTLNFVKNLSMKIWSLFI